MANSEQILTSRYSRRLVTMEKVAPYDAAAAAAHYEALGPPRQALVAVSVLAVPLFLLCASPLSIQLLCALMFFLCICLPACLLQRAPCHLVCRMAIDDLHEHVYAPASTLAGSMSPEGQVPNYRCAEVAPACWAGWAVGGSEPKPTRLWLRQHLSTGG